MLAFVGSEKLVPLALHRGAALARIPAGTHRLGNFERRIGPADRLAGRRDFLFAERRAMRRAGVRLRRRAFRDHRLGDDEARPRSLALGLADRPVYGFEIVAVDGPNDLPVIALEAFLDVIGVPLPDFALVGVDRDA